ncbi:hypothetical protein Tco_1313170 [Tanacetum coccineum]
MGFSSQTVALFPADNAQDDTEPTRFKPIKNPQFFTSPTPPPSPGPFPTQPSLTQPSPTHPSPSDARPRRDLALTFTNTTLSKEVKSKSPPEERKVYCKIVEEEAGYTRERETKLLKNLEQRERKTFMYYQVFRGDGSSKNYKVLSEMLEDFDRLDVEELYRLVKNRYSASSPEGFDLMLWGDLHTLFEPDKDDEIWRDQHEYNLLSWRIL